MNSTSSKPINPQQTDFACVNCGKNVGVDGNIGVKNRNHCPYCLWSKHVDDQIAGDRNSTCQGKMKPVGLTLKKAGEDKYGKPRLGELMIIHDCQKCGKVSINRIAADDDTALILDLLDLKDLSSDKRQQIEADEIGILDEVNTEEVNSLLFGKK